MSTIKVPHDLREALAGVTQIYLVATGDYSDYDIEAAFSTQELAESYCRAHNEDQASGAFTRDADGNLELAYGCEYRIEPIELDPATPPLPRDRLPYLVGISIDGERSRALRRSVAEAAEKRDVICFCGPHGPGGFLFFGTETDHPFMTTYVLARDEEHAVKIAAERRSQVIALHLWPVVVEPYRSVEKDCAGLGLREEELDL